METELRKMLLYAINNVPYYKDIFNHADMREFVSDISCEDDNQWNSVPVMNKDICRSVGSRLLSDEYSHQYTTSRVVIKRTSGSTGKCLNIHWSIKDDIIVNMEAWKWRKKWYGVDIADKYATFHSTLYGSNRFIDDRLYIIKNNNNISFNKTLMNPENINNFIVQMKDYGVSVILTQPSVLNLILKYADCNSMRIIRGMKYIELIGECLSDQQFALFKGLLPEVKISNMYGTTETGYVALTCPFGNMHVLDSTFIEVVDDDNNLLNDNEFGKFLLTSKRNKAMPIIRYDIGDRGKQYWVDCPCGCEKKCIQLKEGRICDTILLSNGNEIPCYVLWYPVEKINAEYMDCIVQYYFVQEELSRITGYLYFDSKYSHWRSAIERRLLDLLHECVGDSISFEIRYQEGNFFATKDKLNFFYRKDEICERS